MQASYTVNDHRLQGFQKYYFWNYVGWNTLENIFSKSYLLGCFQKFNLSKLTCYTVYLASVLKQYLNQQTLSPDSSDTFILDLFL